MGHDLSYGTTAFSRVGRGQEADGARNGEPGAGEGGAGRGFGAAETDPYVVEDPPGRGLGEVGSAGRGPEALPDTGPLVATGDDAAA